MFNSVMGKVGSYAKDTNNLIGNTKNTIINSATEAKSSVNKYAQEKAKSSEDIFDKYWPLIEGVLLSSLVGIAEKGLNNDASLEMAFSTAYTIMPTPFRLLVSKDIFVGVCMSKRGLILNRLSSYKENNNKKPDNKLIEATIDNSKKESLYSDVIPELIAFCIVSDGVVEDSEIEMAAAIINNDENILNKDKAMDSLSLYIEKYITNKKNSEVLYKLNFSSLISKISKVTNQRERERIEIIINGMLSSVNEGSITETKTIADSIKNISFELEPA